MVGTNKRTWLLMIMLVLVIAIAGACSQNTGGENGAPDNTNDPEAVETRGSISVSIYDRGRVAAEEGTQDNNRWTQWMNDNGPNDITWIPIPRAEPIARFNTLFASGSGPDLIMEFDKNYLTELYHKKQLLPIGDLIEQHSVNYKQRLEEFPELRHVSTFDDGEMYGLARVVESTPGGALVIRADWLEQLNLEMPQTTGQLFEVAKAFVEMDPNQSGQRDTYGISLSHWTGAAISYMFGNNVTFYDKVNRVIENGEIVQGWDRLQAATEFKKRLFDAGIVDRDFLTDQDGRKAEQDFLSGRTGIFYYNAAIGNKQLFEMFHENNPEGKLAVLRLPESEFGRYSVLWFNPLQVVGAVNALAKDPVSVIKHIDFMLEEETMRVIQSGFEGVHYEINEAGCYMAIASEENTQQRQYVGDFGMLYNVYQTHPDCQGPAFEDEQLTENWQNFRQDVYSSYAADPLPGLMLHTEHTPALPQDLLLIETTGMERVYDFMSRAIVSGDTYTVEQAIAEAQAYWTQSGGERVDAWYEEWYANNKDTAMLADKIDGFRKDRLFD